MLFTTLAIAASASLAGASVVERRAEMSSFTSAPVSFAFPAARAGTFAVDTQDDAPCNGYALGARTDYPLSGGDLALSSQTTVTDVQFFYSNSSDPKKFHNVFRSYGATAVNKLGAGHFCAKAPDFAAAGLKAGDPATVLVIYQLEGRNEYNYHCADVNLVDAAGFKASTEYVCGNYTSILQEGNEAGVAAAHPSGTTGGFITGAESTAAPAASSGASTAGASSGAGAMAVPVLGLAAAAAGAVMTLW